MSLRTILRGLFGLDAVAVVRVEPLMPVEPPVLLPPSGGEPPVSADALLDLALVMRDLWWPDAGFAGPQAQGHVGAALARCFPAYVTTVERCPCEVDDVEPGQPKCDVCATDADMAALDARLAAWLRDLPRPAVIPPLTVSLRALVAPAGATA